MTRAEQLPPSNHAYSYSHSSYLQEPNTFKMKNGSFGKSFLDTSQLKGEMVVAQNYSSSSSSRNEWSLGNEAAALSLEERISRSRYKHLRDKLFSKSETLSRCSSSTQAASLEGIPSDTGSELKAKL